MTEYAIQSRHQTRQAEKPQVEEITAFRVSTVASDATARSCTEKQLADPLKWWRCSTEPKELGRDDEAKAELDLFNASHPVFEPPHSP